MSLAEEAGLVSKGGGHHTREFITAGNQDWFTDLVA